MFFILPSCFTANIHRCYRSLITNVPFSYFLCYEDISDTQTEADGDSQGVTHCNVVRMWSIGQWVQVNPDPDKEDIYDWYNDFSMLGGLWRRSGILHIKKTILKHVEKDHQQL